MTQSDDSVHIYLLLLTCVADSKQLVALQLSSSGHCSGHWAVDTIADTSCSVIDKTRVSRAVRTIAIRCVLVL